MYKYKLIYLIRQLPFEAYKTAIKDMANLCNVSENTIRNWIYLKKSSHYDLSYQNVLELADFFNVQPKDLYNE